MSKFFNVNEAAKLLGLSPMTVRRRIMSNEIHAELISKRLGYKISEEELFAYAKKMNHKVGIFWSKDDEQADFSHSKAFAAMTAPKVNINTSDLIQRLKKRRLYTPDPDDLNNLKVLDKVISLLKEKLNFLNSKISRLNEPDDSLDDLMDEQMALKDDIGNFEIHKSVCELHQNKNAK